MHPFESPIEHDFYFAAEKYLNEGIQLRPQITFPTIAGKLRVDFVIDSPHRIAFECDGQDFHERFRDEVRDAVLLGEQHINTIYHIPGSLIHHRPMELFYCISRWDPDIFSHRAMRVLEESTQGSSGLWVDGHSESTVVAGAEIMRRHWHVPNGRRAHWKAIYERIKNQPSFSIDEFVEGARRPIDD